MDEQFLTLVYRIIDDNLADEYFSVEKLAKDAGLSRSMLHRKLIKLTGKSATDLIMDKRLDLARELLENDTGTVSEIAYKTGFNSPSYFHRAFKRRYHISPGDVKKNASISHTQGDIARKSENLIPKERESKKVALIASVIFIVLMISGAIYYLSGKKSPPEKSIAILPFDNLSSDEENQYLADGLVEDLLNQLSRFEELKVISRTSSEMFRNKGNKSVPEIAEILGVNYILEGSVQREESNIRVSIQLIDARKDDHILSKQYNRNLSEVFKMQRDIANEIIRELSVYLTDDKPDEITRYETSNLKAFNFYQMGRYNVCRCSKEETLASIEYYRKAIREDNNYALAYAGLADAYRFMAQDGYMADRKAGRDSAIMLALKALDIDRNTAEAHTVLGGVFMMIDHKMEAAEKEFLNAIGLNPNSSYAYKEYARLLAMTDRPKKARESMNTAIALDPVSFTNRNLSSILYLKEKDYRKALEETQLSLELVKDHPYAVDRLPFIYLGLGDEKDAVESFRRVGPLKGEYTEKQADSAYLSSGINGLLRLKAETWSWIAGRAYCYALMGKNERAIEILESAINENQLTPFDIYQITTTNLTSDPRFKSMVKKFGLKI